MDGGDSYDSGCHKSDNSCHMKKKQVIKIKKRICNATADSSFDANEFISNSTYYADCDCAIFVNCTNTTIIPPPEPIPVPPLPPSGSACNYTCEDIRALHVTIVNLTEIVARQQDDIDMLMYQVDQIKNMSSSGSSGNTSCCADHEARLDSLDKDVAQLYEHANNATAAATEATLANIRDNGLRFGTDWWFGSQGDYLFAIDVATTSYYRFDPDVNRTL
jgi:hypothetical protein